MIYETSAESQTKKDSTSRGEPLSSIAATLNGKFEGPNRNPNSNPNPNPALAVATLAVAVAAAALALAAARPVPSALPVPKVG
tara:strand:+ start:183 stop:431 length:249 start_codon:yes stop_codon:yes gene_type:complete